LHWAHVDVGGGGATVDVAVIVRVLDDRQHVAYQTAKEIEKRAMENSVVGTQYLPRLLEEQLIWSRVCSM